MSENLVWTIVTVLGSIVGSWSTMKAEQRHLRKEVDEIKREHDEWRSVSLQLAAATTTIAHLDNRLNRIEDKVDAIRRVTA